MGIINNDFTDFEKKMGKATTRNENTLLHTEEIKKKYTEVERDIKRKLTELLLLDSCGDDSYVCRGLSIDKYFGIRELTDLENNKFTMNLASIKDGTLENTEKAIKAELFDIIERKVDDKEVASAYKERILSFFENKLRRPRMEYLKKHPTYQAFILQYHDLYKSQKKEGVAKFNVIVQTSKILYEKF